MLDIMKKIAGYFKVDIGSVRIIRGRRSRKNLWKSGIEYGINRGLYSLLCNKLYHF